MPASALAAPAAPGDLPRRLLTLTGQYRVLVAGVLLLTQRLATGEWTLVTPRPRLFLLACLAYLVAAVLLLLTQRLKGPSLRLQALVNACVDAAGLGLILYASGGVASGLGILLVLPVMAMATLAGRRGALAVAAIASTGVLVQQVYVGTPADYPGAAVLACVLFAIALSASPIANRLRESEALVRRQKTDLANLEELSHLIVERLREGLLVLDLRDRVRLINDAARAMLGSSPPAALRPRLGEVSPHLQHLLESWRRHGEAGAGVRAADTFPSADGTRMLQADFARLGKTSPGAVLVFLTDTSAQAEEAQENTLKALARLSASIAHEIKNPVGAMSHAGQLLEESANLSDDDRNLTQIIRRNADRVTAIIDSVQRLSRRDTRLEQLPLPAWVEAFSAEFCGAKQWPRDWMPVAGAATDLKVRADPEHLHQIVWNLCENALKHGVPSTRWRKSVELRYGRMPLNNRPFLEVLDRGPGVPPEHAERIFEPFFSTGQGTGLGLFLARELAQSSGATLLYKPRKGGGSIFRITFSDPQRWARETKRRA